MSLPAFATDYDGTLADRGVVAPEAVAALRRAKAVGRQLLLVTGRRLPDLLAVFPDAALFTRIVAENGALLHNPATGASRLLASPPPDALLVALTARGVQPLTLGQVVVATTSDHELAVRDALLSLGIGWQLIFNKDSLMLLPRGVDKVSGLRVALGEIGSTTSETLAVGDAENDLGFLATCGLGAAVANALPAVRQQADIVATLPNGAGVAELIDRLLAGTLPVRGDRGLGR